MNIKSKERIIWVQRGRFLPDGSRDYLAYQSILVLPEELVDVEEDEREAHGYKPQKQKIVPSKAGLVLETFRESGPGLYEIDYQREGTSLLVREIKSVSGSGSQGKQA